MLARAAQDDPKLKFRKEVEKVVKRSNGKISTIARSLLIGKSQGLDSLEVEAIINEVKLPYDEYERKLKKYEQDLVDMIAEEFPFSQVVQQELQEYENHLGLREDDITIIKERIIAPKQAKYERFEGQRKKIAEVDRQKQEQERLSLLEQLRKQAEEEEQLKRQQVEIERIGRQIQSKPAQPEFEFEIIQVKLNKKTVIVQKEVDSFFGLSKKLVDKEEQRVTVSLDRKKGKAEYIRESLGNGVTLDLVRIPAGKFRMGSNEYDSEKPIHDVSVKEFLIGRYAITNAQWENVMGTKPSKIGGVKFQGANQPVINVSWDDAKEFCKKLSEKINKNVRLPSEAEWEYACRAGTTTSFHFGETITPELVNYDGNYPYGDAPKGEYRRKTVDVQNFSPNAWGLYQMHGNVREWCEDVWHEKYNGAPTDGSAWLIGGEQNRRALRGGSWFFDAFYCRSANRDRGYAGYSNNSIGFRVVVA